MKKQFVFEVERDPVPINFIGYNKLIIYLVAVTPEIFHRFFCLGIKHKTPHITTPSRNKKTNSIPKHFDHNEIMMKLRAETVSNSDVIPN